MTTGHTKLVLKIVWFILRSTTLCMEIFQSGIYVKRWADRTYTSSPLCFTILFMSSELDTRGTYGDSGVTSSPFPCKLLYGADLLLINKRFSPHSRSRPKSCIEIKNSVYPHRVWFGWTFVKSVQVREWFSFCLHPNSLSGLNVSNRTFNLHPLFF